MQNHNISCQDIAKCFIEKILSINLFGLDVLLSQCDAETLTTIKIKNQVHEVIGCGLLAEKLTELGITQLYFLYSEYIIHPFDQNRIFVQLVCWGVIRQVECQMILTFMIRPLVGMSKISQFLFWICI